MSGRAAATLAGHRVPGSAQSDFVGDADGHAADIALVHE